MKTYKVKTGDTLSAIARRNGTTVSELQRLNGISNPDLIRPGQQFVLPSPASNLTPIYETTSAAKKAAEAGVAKAQKLPATPPGGVVGQCSPNDPDFKIRAGGDDNIDVLYLTADAKGNRAGLLGHGSVEANVGMVKMEHAGHLGNPVFGGSHNLEVYTAQAKAEGGIVAGLGMQAEASSRMVKEGLSAFVGTDKNNPLAELGGEYSLMTAEAKANALLGSDGKRAGFALGGKLGAAAAEGDIKGELNIPIPFTDWSISGRGKAGASGGSLGIGGNVHALKDLETGRYHLGASGKAAALVGLMLDLDVSIGPEYTDRMRPNGQ